MKYLNNGNLVENSFDVELINGDGKMQGYYRLDNNVKEKITLSDLVNAQFNSIESCDKSETQSGDLSQSAQSGDWSKSAQSGDWSKSAQSGYGSKSAQSGYGSKSAQSGDRSKSAQSGDLSQSAQSGYGSKSAQSGYGSQSAQSGDRSKSAQSGDLSQSAQSGDWSKSAQSGDRSKSAQSGDLSQSAQSGYGSKSAQSGDRSKSAQSGDRSKSAQSGDLSQSAQSGDWSKSEINGNNSISFSCGYRSIIKGVNGTWISLAEYKKDENFNYIPFFALSGQIGNENYKDCNGNTLHENEWYLLNEKMFTPVIIDDDIILKKINSRHKNEIEIITCKDLDNGNKIYCAREGELSSHGYTVKEAVRSLHEKMYDDKPVEERIEEFKNHFSSLKKKYKADDFYTWHHILTNSCIPGRDNFAKEHNIDLENDKFTVIEFIELTENAWNGEVIKRLKDSYNEEV